MHVRAHFVPGSTTIGGFIYSTICCADKPKVVIVKINGTQVFAGGKV